MSNSNSKKKLNHTEIQVDYIDFPYGTTKKEIREFLVRNGYTTGVKVEFLTDFMSEAAAVSFVSHKFDYDLKTVVGIPVDFGAKLFSYKFIELMGQVSVWNSSATKELAAERMAIEKHIENNNGHNIRYIFAYACNLK